MRAAMEDSRRRENRAAMTVMATMLRVLTAAPPIYPSGPDHPHVSGIRLCLNPEEGRRLSGIYQHRTGAGRLLGSGISIAPNIPQHIVPSPPWRIYAS